MRCGRISVGVALIVLVAGCSSDRDVARPADALPPGTATVAIDSGRTQRIPAVSCLALNDAYTQIAVGNDSNGVQVLVDKGSDVAVKSLSITDVDGFTGSYWQGVQGGANAGATNNVFTFKGTAHGYDGSNPNAATDAEFHIEVAC